MKTEVEVETCGPTLLLLSLQDLQCIALLGRDLGQREVGAAQFCAE